MAIPDPKADEPARPRLAVIAPYARFLPPQNGGHLRTYFLLRELSRSFELEVISHVVPDKATASAVRAIGLDPSQFHCATLSTAGRRPLPYRLIARMRFAHLVGDWRLPVNSSIESLSRALGERLAARPFAGVLLETLPPAWFANTLRASGQPLAVIHDAHNVDSVLAQQERTRARKSSGRHRLHNRRRTWREAQLHRDADASLCCSEDDRKILAQLNDNRLPGYVVPNGVDTVNLPFLPRPIADRGRHLLFCGSLDHPPNREGLDWFFAHVWPRLRGKNVTMTIIGRQGSSVDRCCWGAGDARVELVGDVPSTLPYYERAAIAIVPLLSGSGTRLKILEAMSLGTPVVSTTLGAQGIEAGDGHLVRADIPEAFVAAILQLFEDPAAAERRRRAGRRLVETRYDWKIIGGIARDCIRCILAPDSRPLSCG